MELPIGSIIVWDSDSIPDKWHICDGTDGTPNMVNRFVYGASTDEDLEDTGGAASHYHTNADTNSTGSHSHDNVTFTLSTATSPTGKCNYEGSNGACGPHNHASGTITFNANANHSHTVGNSSTDSNLPPYIKLYYIIKIS